MERYCGQAENKLTEGKTRWRFICRSVLIGTVWWLKSADCWVSVLVSAEVSDSSSCLHERITCTEPNKGLYLLIIIFKFRLKLTRWCCLSSNTSAENNADVCETMWNNCGYHDLQSLYKAGLFKSNHFLTHHCCRLLAILSHLPCCLTCTALFFLSVFVLFFYIFVLLSLTNA